MNILNCARKKFFPEKSDEKKSEIEFLLYKILHDAVFLIAVVLFAMLVVEGMIPDIISRYLNFTGIVFVLAAALLGINYLGEKNGLKPSAMRIRGVGKTVFATVLSIISLAVFLSALFKLSFLRFAVIFFGMMLMLFLFYKIFLTEKDDKI